MFLERMDLSPMRDNLHSLGLLSHHTKSACCHCAQLQSLCQTPAEESLICVRVFAWRRSRNAEGLYPIHVVAVPVSTICRRGTTAQGHKTVSHSRVRPNRKVILRTATWLRHRSGDRFGCGPYLHMHDMCRCTCTFCSYPLLGRK